MNAIEETRRWYPQRFETGENDNDDVCQAFDELFAALDTERARAERLAIVVNHVASCQFEEMYTSITPNVRIYINRDVMMLARELADDSADDGGAA